MHSVDTTNSLSAPATGSAERYDALNPQGRRKTPKQTIRREDVYLKGGKRNRLQATSNDIVRNFAIAAWAVRRHLDYVARFEFQASNDDEGLNREIEQLVAIQSRPREFDRGGRFGREKAFRIAESRRVIDNDTFLVLLRSGQVQGIEADLCRDPKKTGKGSKGNKPFEGHEWVDGIEVDFAGLPRRYSFYGRENGSSYVHRKNVAARNVIHYGFFDRYASEQVRGLSPIIASLNSFRDVYENFDYALAKAKIHQLFAIAVTRKAEEALDTAFGADNDEEGDDETTPPPRDIDLTGGPMVLDFEENEMASVIESKNPSTEFQNFAQLVTMCALKALDIPYSFFDESHTNFSGSRGSWLHYERACMDRRDDQLEMRRRWTIFQLQRWTLSGLLTLPSGMTIGDLKWSWIPKGMPWWKPSEELTADLKAIAAGVTSLPDVCAKNGTGDPKDNIRKTAEIIKYAREVGEELLEEPFRLNFDPGPFPSAVTSQEQPDA